LRACDDDLVDQVEDAQEHANLFLETCRAALQLQYQRVLDLAEARPDKTDWRVLEPDCYLLVLALKQAVVSVEAVAHFKGESIKENVDETIARLTEDNHLGDLKDVRDMLTHFDWYLKGKGNIQKIDEMTPTSIPTSTCMRNGDAIAIPAKCSFGSGHWRDPPRCSAFPERSWI
jgi:hypothetical protein